MQIPEIAAFFAALDEATAAVHCYQRALPALVQAQPAPTHVLEVAQYRLAEGSDPAVFLERCRGVRALIATWDGFLRFDTLRATRHQANGLTSFVGETGLLLMRPCSASSKK